MSANHSPEAGEPGEVGRCQVTLRARELRQVLLPGGKVRPVHCCGVGGDFGRRRPPKKGRCSSLYT